VGTSTRGGFSDIEYRPAEPPPGVPGLEW
jgi:hypothetical protein